MRIKIGTFLTLFCIFSSASAFFSGFPKKHVRRALKGKIGFFFNAKLWDGDIYVSRQNVKIRQIIPDGS
jgi:hypothetical protein